MKSRLVADDLVKARRIDVDTRDRVVTLTGEVRSSQEESQALQIAKNTAGVANVVDRLSVVPLPEESALTTVSASRRALLPLAQPASMPPSRHGSRQSCWRIQTSAT